MADLSTIYPGVIEYHDPDIVIASIPGTFPWQPKRKLYLPDPVRELIRKNNALSKSTVDAVKVAPTAVRTTWLKERIDAVDERVKFIKTRTDGLLSALLQNGDPLYNTLLSGVKLAISAVPVVGPLVGTAINANQTAQAQATSIEQIKIQGLIRDYTSDLGELAKIRILLAKEYAGPSLLGLGKDEDLDPKLFAPETWPTWYYYVVAAVILLLILYVRNHNLKKR